MQCNLFGSCGAVHSRPFAQHSSFNLEFILDYEGQTVMLTKNRSLLAYSANGGEEIIEYAL